MKRTLLTLALLAVGAGLFAEKVTFTAGSIAGKLPECYLPLDFTAGATCSVTAVRRVEKDLWCLVLTAAKSTQNAAYPVTYEYYLKIGDKIRMRKTGTGLTEHTLTVTRLGWNEAEFLVE